MRSRLLGFIYILIFVLLIASCLIAWQDKGIKALWGALVLAFLYLLPALLERWLKITIPPLLKYLTFLFLFLSLDIGGILSVYKRYDMWDNFVYFTSGFLTCTLGLSMINILNRDPLTLKKLRPCFIFVFILIFAMAAGLLWEYCEFTADSLFGTNQMTDTLLNNGQIDIGLLDTMSDLLDSQAAALIMAIFYYCALRKDQWLKLSSVIIQVDG